MNPRPVAVLALALLGCGPEAPPPSARQPNSAAPRAPEVRAEPPPVASPAPPVPPAPPGPKFSMTELAPTQGDLTPLLAMESKRAKAKGFVAVIEFYADWCPPCRVFEANIEAPEITAALTGTHLVKLNLDDWHDKLKGTGFAPRTIPSFYFVDEAGRPTGKMLDGDRWGKATPARMGAALEAFLRGSTRAP